MCRGLQGSATEENNDTQRYILLRKLKSLHVLSSAELKQLSNRFYQKRLGSICII